MESRPQIKTAIPKRRYQLGSHGVTVLGEIESGDARQYRYLMAYVPTGQREPSLYVCAERTPPAERDAGIYRLRLVSELLDEIVDTHDRWGDLDAFAEQGLKLGRQALGLQQASLQRLL